MKNRLFILLILLPGLGHAQDTVAVTTNPTAPIHYTTKNAWHISALIPGIIYERRLGTHTTLVGEYGLGMVLADAIRTYSGPSSFPEYNIPDFRLNSKASVGIRHYYDFERRVKHGRSIRYNSSGYVMVKVGYRFAPFSGRDEGRVTFRPGLGPFVAGVWGFQRTYRKNLYLNLAAGPQLWGFGLSFGVDAAIGYTLPTSNKKP